MEVKVDISGMVKECIDKELNDTIGNVHELMHETYSINSCLAGKADKCLVEVNDQRISNLEHETQPANMLNNMLRDYQQLEEYRSIGTPYYIRNRMDTIAKDRDKYYDETKNWQTRYKILSDEKLNIQSKSAYFEDLRRMLCDMMNSYDSYTAGLTDANTGTARFFYINALSNVMNKIVEMEKSKNGYC